MIFLAVIAATFLFLVIAIFGGTMVWWLWPIAIPAAFPGLVASGALASDLTWGQAVALTYVCSFLLKSSAVVPKNEN